MTLDEIAIQTGTDKSSHFHNYCTKYEKYLPFKKEYNIKLLEIGVLNGSSLKMWKEYYRNYQYIVGLDINPNCKCFEEQQSRLYVEIGSQTDESFLSTVMAKYGVFDLIIDDGSHVQKDVLYTFEKLFSCLKSGGVYIVEDVCCSYWNEYGGSLTGENTAVAYFRQLVDHVNFFGERYTREDFKFDSNCRNDKLLIEESLKQNKNFKTDIESINFINSAILITKR
jgi:hypothetical protein